MAPRQRLLRTSTGGQRRHARRRGTLSTATPQTTASESPGVCARPPRPHCVDGRFARRRQSLSTQPLAIYWLHAVVSQAPVTLSGWCSVEGTQADWLGIESVGPCRARGSSSSSRIAWGGYIADITGSSGRQGSADSGASLSFEICGRRERKHCCAVTLEGCVIQVDCWCQSQLISVPTAKRFCSASHIRGLLLEQLRVASDYPAAANLEQSILRRSVGGEPA